MDRGFDVWLTNQRGNAYSTEHAWLSPKSREYWNFSFDETATFDFPANIEYVLSQTGARKLNIVAHSEGTTQTLAALSRPSPQLPKPADKISAVVLLAPVAFLNHVPKVNPLIKLAVDAHVVEAAEALGALKLPGPILDGLIHLPGSQACSIASWSSKACEFAISRFCGATTHLNTSRIGVYLAQIPSGSMSVKDAEHWMQGLRSRSPQFQMYDYGCGLFRCRNLERYGTRTPPVYDLRSYPKDLPTTLYHGTNDIISTPDDVAALLAMLPPGAVQAHTVEGYAHMDFTWGEDAHVLVYSDLIKQLQAATA